MKSDDLTTTVIKGKSSLNKSFFHNLFKHMSLVIMCFLTMMILLLWMMINLS
jgi:hypothetical protein